MDDSSSDPDRDSQFFERVRSVLKDSTEFAAPPADSVARAKAAFAEHRRQQQLRLIWISTAIVVCLIIAVILLLVTFNRF